MILHSIKVFEQAFLSFRIVVTDRSHAIPYKHCKQHIQTTGNLSCFTLQVMLNVLKFIVRDFASSQCGFHFPCLHDGF